MGVSKEVLRALKLKQSDVMGYKEYPGKWVVVTIHGVKLTYLKGAAPPDEDSPVADE